MNLPDLSAPAAVVISVVSAAVGAVFSVAVWQIFKTGRAEIEHGRAR